LLYPEGETNQIYAEVLPQLAETGMWAGETVGLRKDGSTIVEDHRLATTAGDEMVCTVRDVTTEHEQRRQLEEQEAALRETYEVISDREKSFDEKIEALLKIGQTVIGTEAASLSHVDGDDYRFEVVRAPDESVQAGDVVPVSATNCERAIETEETLVLENVAEDAPELADRAGNTDWGISCYLGAPVLVDDDVYGTLCFYGETPREESFTDWQVTLVDLLSRWISYELEREDHERALEQYREYTDNVLDAIDDVFYVLDESGELRRWNESLTEVTGYPDEEIESMHALEFFDGSDRDEIAEAISEGFETGQTRVEAAFRTRSGDAIPYEFVAVTLEDPDRDRILAGIGRDITRRREQERALQESNERLEQFAYAASHDL
jgi:PAS domain S-box-containing protein